MAVREFGDAMRVARNKAGLTQQQLADKTGTSQTVISQLEKGRIPSGDVLHRVFERLELDPEVAGAELIFDDPVERVLWQQKWMRADERAAMLTFYKLARQRADRESAA